MEAGEIVRKEIFQTGKKQVGVLRDDSNVITSLETGLDPRPVRKIKSTEELIRGAEKVELNKPKENNKPLENTLNGVV